MAENKKKFEYDPEDEQKDRSTRLPFALCKAHGIPIQDWWTPRHAWEALQNEGYVKDVDEEIKKYFRNLKKKQASVSAKIRAERNKRKKKQLANPDLNPDESYEHQEGKIAGAEKGNPMSFEEADSGRVNPNFTTAGAIGFRTNCQTCVAVYAARRMGYDVYALPNLNNESIFSLSHNTSLAYLTKDGKHPSYLSIPLGVNRQKWLEKNLEQGKIYSIEFHYVGRRSGHIITVEKTPEGIKFYDPQTNRVMKDLSWYGKVSNLRLMNLSDCQLDEKFCDKIMKPTKK